jgi:hypothetical protein
MQQHRFSNKNKQFTDLKCLATLIATLSAKRRSPLHYSRFHCGLPRRSAMKVVTSVFKETPSASAFATRRLCIV